MSQDHVMGMAYRVGALETPFYPFKVEYLDSDFVQFKFQAGQRYSIQKERFNRWPEHDLVSVESVPRWNFNLDAAPTDKIVIFSHSRIGFKDKLGQWRNAMGKPIKPPRAWMQWPE